MKYKYYALDILITYNPLKIFRLFEYIFVPNATLSHRSYITYLLHALKQVMYLTAKVCVSSANMSMRPLHVKSVPTTTLHTCTVVSGPLGYALIRPRIS